ncbi:TPA: 50S ribosomal protein L21 [Candidatus Saccharibacteria bacterium]|nr:MAG: 50S ribosomal protein L21 [Candidatus Saccharibacteria bacterium RIFCSPHIGHO2_12_FULL_47_17]OGL38047.1 MAG: 50S ribosomal protein L21 [Candidatus Saccharibacteria bacterium RIFCSPLOWO2_02_FULL_46_7]HCM51944.1 50S ribosomal protein L21 [Candidatus Saccharibacteria bacterium]
MKKAAITTGGKQYLVTEGQELEVDKLKDDNPSTHSTGAQGRPEETRRATSSGQGKINFEALLLIDGEKVDIGTPTLTGVKVTAEVIEPEVKAEKVVAIRYKAKKRVHKRRGHRQRLSRIRISKIA